MGSDLLPRNKPRKMSDIKRQVQQMIKKFVPKLRVSGQSCPAER